MASLRKKPNSKFWIACFTDDNGVQRQRSTGTTERLAAIKVAIKYEDTHRKQMTEDQVRRTMNDLCEEINGRRLNTSTVSAFFARWLASKAANATASTVAKYKDVLERFEAFLGPQRSGQDLGRLGVADFAEFRDELAKSVGAGTVNLATKILSVAMRSAWRDSLIPENPAAKLVPLKRSRKEDVHRRPFTLGELRLILAHANTEWRGIILCGLYTGQRLGDIAGLCWRNVDLERKEIRFVTQKTERVVILPIVEVLAKHLLSLPSADDGDAPVFPSSHGILKAEGRAGTLSNQFYGLLVAAGLADKRTHKKAKDGKGRSAKRQLNELSFHSLRHTTTSMLKNAGAAEGVVMDIVGHESASVSQNYTKIEDDSKRQALALLPDITAPVGDVKGGRKSRKI